MLGNSIFSVQPFHVMRLGIFKRVEKFAAAYFPKSIAVFLLPKKSDARKSVFLSKTAFYTVNCFPGAVQTQFVFSKRLGLFLI